MTRLRKLQLASVVALVILTFWVVLTAWVFAVAVRECDRGSPLCGLCVVWVTLGVFKICDGVSMCADVARQYRREREGRA